MPLTVHSKLYPGKMLRVIALLFASFLFYFSLVSFYGSDPVVLSSIKPPQGHTGVTGIYCTSCHSSFARNSAGGSVVVNGLPSGVYSAGQKYNFSISITHANADRKKWGFSIIAVNSGGLSVGTFASTNANAAPNGNELSHNNAVLTSLQKSYTYSGLSWTAPASPGIKDATVTFYFVANAANGNGGSDGDYIYSDVIQAKLGRIYTFTGDGNWSSGANWSGGQVPPDTLSGSDAEIVVRPFEGSECILDKVQVINGGAKLTISPGASLRIPANFNIK